MLTDRARQLSGGSVISVVESQGGSPVGDAYVVCLCVRVCVCVCVRVGQ